MDWNHLSTTSESYSNAPSMLSIYTTQLMCEYMLTMGGINHFEKEANNKSKLLYKILDNSSKN
jgi:phosphoserine aminotransferase